MSVVPRRNSCLGIRSHGAAVLAIAFVLFSTPAEARAPSTAGWLARGIGVAGVTYALKENLGELIDRAGDASEAIIHGKDAKVREIWAEVEKTPGRILEDAFLVLKIKAGLQSAERKIKRFAGRVGGAVLDARAALAVSSGERNFYEAETGVLSERALPEPSTPASTKAPGNSASASAWSAGTADNAALDEVQRYALKCWYHSVRPKTVNYGYYKGLLEKARWMGDDLGCMNDGVGAGEHGKPREQDSAWAGETAIKHREYEVAKDAADVLNDAEDAYAAALTRALGEEPTTASGGDYQAALSALEAKEAERRRFEAQERERLARLAERKRIEAKERAARLTEQTRIEAEEREARLAERKRIRTEERKREARRAERQRLDAQERARLARRAQQQRQFETQMIENLTQSLTNMVNILGSSHSSGAGSVQSYDHDQCLDPDGNCGSR